MITLRKKIYSPDLTIDTILNAFTKPELKTLINLLGFDLTTAARKNEFVESVADIILNRQDDVLQNLSVESLDILAELLHADEGTFIARPHVPVQRDLQRLSLVLTYEEDGTDYLTISKDVRERYTSRIDDYLNSSTVKLQRTVEPYIIGLSNLLGLCPMPLLQETLKRDGIDVALSDIERCRFRVNNRPLIFAKGEAAPVPYSEQYKEVAYVPSLYFTNDEAKVSKFLNESLHADGFIHKKYREFTREEILAAGQHVPDFCWKEAEALKQEYAEIGYSETKIASNIVELWHSHVYDDEENARHHLSFANEKLQALYEDFCKIVPRWVSRGFCDTPIDGEFDESIAEVKNEFERVAEIYKNLPEANSSDVKFDNVLSRNPKAKPNGDNIGLEVIYKRVIRLTTLITGDIYFIGYLINEGDQSRLIANFGHVYDFITMPYVNGDTIEISRGTAKKYPTFTKLAEARAKRDLGVPYLNTVGFNGNPKTWCLMQWLPLDAEDWLDFALKTDTGFDLTEGIDEGMATDIENEMTDEVTDDIEDEVTDDITAEITDDIYRRSCKLPCETTQI
jgi:hypothetical protein